MDILDIMVMDMVTGPMEVTDLMGMARERLRLWPSQDTIMDTMDTDLMVMDTGPMEDTGDIMARERPSQFTGMVMVMDTGMDIMVTVDMVTEEDTTMAKPKLSFTQYVLSSVLEPLNFQNFQNSII